MLLYYNMVSGEFICRPKVIKVTEYEIGVKYYCRSCRIRCQTVHTARLSYLYLNSVCARNKYEVKGNSVVASITDPQYHVSAMCLCSCGVAQLVRTQKEPQWWYMTGLQGHDLRLRHLQNIPSVSNYRHLMRLSSQAKKMKDFTGCKIISPC